MADILRDVRYRIYNLDTGSYVERHDKSTVNLRPLKEGSLKQQWYFVKQPNTDVYEIQNAYEKTSVIDATYASKSGSLTVAKQTTKSRKWQLGLDFQNKTYYILSNDFGNQDVLVYAENFGILSLEQDKNIDDIKRINKGDEYQWKIIEDSSASLPDGDGKYRIRTLTGMAVHCVEPGNTLSIVNQTRGDHRAWDLVSYGNGKCTIYNAGDGAWLATKKTSDGFWIPALSTTDKQMWDIQPTSDLTYSICIDKPMTVNRETIMASLALSLKGTDIILKPQKKAHNQLWMMELDDALLDIPNNNGNGNGNGIGNGNGAGGTNTVAAGLNTGEYFLQNRGTGSYYVYVKVNNSTSTFEILAGGEDDSNDFKVDKKAGGQPGEVYIYYTGNGLTKYLSSNGSKVVAENNPFTWLVQSGSTTGQYYVCAGNNLAQCISAPAAGTKSFTIGAKVDSPNNMWSFITP